ncbi:hypothetical protein [Engelhardtia mirabilis]|uniref:Cortical protein marker for cell polarity n=1 Tax=Engelhardtia mirabilis TaxID=2528011 RepID=A0A518BJ43_9BACT|nr:hypothetical protein Pla133_20740 [Planctomycetes bacterium Pla133]QDV01324.1 hypothetical protein Pla86_20740 [Planctomycetes bacterium Pla86]
MRPTPTALFAPLALAALTGPAVGQGTELLYSNPSNSSYTAVQSYSTPVSSFPLEFEAADDFNGSGLVQRLTVHGKQCFPCQPADVAEVVVRFYEWTTAGPGALVSMQSVAAGDPGFVYDPTGVDDLEIVLPAPYVIDGPGFVSVQLTMGPADGYWGWWISNKDAPSGSSVWFRSATQGGQWGPVDQIVGGDLVADLAFSLWGSTGTVPTPSTDPCGQWGILTTPLPSESNKSILRGVAAISDDDVWAVGEAAVTVAPGDVDNVVQALHWDGSGWTSVPVPVPDPYPGGGNAWLSAVAATSSDDVWAAGTYSAIGGDGFVTQEVLIVRWDGSDWSLVPNAPKLEPGVSGAWIRGIEILAPDDIWFVGDFPRVIDGFGVRYAGAIHWDGSGFTIFDTPLNNTDENGLSGVSAVAPDDIWAVGGRYGDGFLIDPYVLHYDGSSWQLVTTPKPGITHSLFDVAAIASDDVWAIGQTNTGAGIVGFALHWDGSSWSEVPFSGGSLALHAFASDDVYAVGAVVSHWDGGSWSVVEDFDGANGVSLGAVDASAPCKLFAAGRHAVAGNLVNISAKLDADPWTDLGGASPLNPAPSLAGVGNLEAQSEVILRAAELPATAPTWLIVGASTLNLPIAGGTLVPNPDLVLSGLSTDSFGRLDYEVTWAPGVPAGASLFVQMWSLELVGGGLAATNGLQGVTP